MINKKAIIFSFVFSVLVTFALLYADIATAVSYGRIF